MKVNVKTLRPYLLGTLTAFVLAVIYNFTAGLFYSITNEEPIFDFGAIYLDIVYFGALIFILKWVQKKRPAIRRGSGPVIIVIERLAILMIPIIILNRLIISLKVATGDWYSFISFSQISTYTIIALLLILLYMVLDLVYELMDHWRVSEAEKERLGRLHTQAQLENLKAQVNPHFLFNSLNTLSSLIIEDEHRARQFVRQLSTVYRYILENREKNEVSLANEKRLFDSFIYLCETRFEENFRVETKWPNDLEMWLIPPMTLQILVENAIKHNIISKQKPLHLWVKFDDGKLEIGNNYQPKKQLETGTGFGLSNVVERFSQLSRHKVDIQQTETSFVVTLPLAKA